MIIFQTPNKSAVVAFGGWLGLKLFHAGLLHWLALAVYIVAGAIWSYMEITDGANWLRRIFGLLVLWSVVMAAISIFR